MSDYASMTVANLRTLLKDRGIPLTGLSRKQQMVEKLEESHSTSAKQEKGASKKKAGKVSVVIPAPALEAEEEEFPAKTTTRSRTTRGAPKDSTTDEVKPLKAPPRRGRKPAAVVETTKLKKNVVTAPTKKVGTKSSKKVAFEEEAEKIQKEERLQSLPPVTRKRAAKEPPPAAPAAKRMATKAKAAPATTRSTRQNGVEGPPAPVTSTRGALAKETAASAAKKTTKRASVKKTIKASTKAKKVSQVESSEGLEMVDAHHETATDDLIGSPPEVIEVVSTKVETTVAIKTPAWNAFEASVRLSPTKPALQTLGTTTSERPMTPLEHSSALTAPPPPSAKAFAPILPTLEASVPCSPFKASSLVSPNKNSLFGPSLLRLSPRKVAISSTLKLAPMGSTHPSDSTAQMKGSLLQTSPRKPPAEARKAVYSLVKAVKAEGSVPMQHSPRKAAVDARNTPSQSVFSADVNAPALNHSLLRTSPRKAPIVPKVSSSQPSRALFTDDGLNMFKATLMRSSPRKINIASQRASRRELQPTVEDYNSPFKTSLVKASPRRARADMQMILRTASPAKIARGPLKGRKSLLQRSLLNAQAEALLESDIQGQNESMEVEVEQEVCLETEEQQQENAELESTTPPASPSKAVETHASQLFSLVPGTPHDTPEIAGHEFEEQIAIMDFANVSPVKTPGLSRTVQMEEEHTYESTSDDVSKTPELRLQPIILEPVAVTPGARPSISPRKSSLRSPRKNAQQSPKKNVSWDAETNTPLSEAMTKGVLTGTVVYVDVNENDGRDASNLFIPLLLDLGARVVSHWLNDNQSITHVLFKDGSKRTLDKVAFSNGAIKCVNIGWAMACERANAHVPESGYLIPLPSTTQPLATLSANTTPTHSPVRFTPFTSSSVKQTAKSAPTTPFSGIKTPKLVLNTTPASLKSVDKENFTVASCFGDSPGTPYYLKGDLVQMTCPPKQTRKGFFEEKSPVKKLDFGKRRSLGVTLGQTMDWD
ncbi:hypothetical protein M501DRAFT_1030676 [Patellaria atrata CBS 101060]|uniref:BRCT domain-containing protein n=1 Tax=Patellaria atrata CBS 101060 TaxID=1346257 RepID=A0A9P4SD16_9PEZI|nr:hypothetical protein M501DRAFT_1030676 [Patellaria atrata CBS 101060]